MGSKLAVTDSHKHKIAKKIFFTDDKLVHRKVRKKFLTRDGVHRMVYSSGTRWKKYSCNVSHEVFAYQRVESLGGKSIGDTEVWETSYIKSYRAYAFSDTNGFQGTGGAISAEGPRDDIITATGYIVDRESVYRIETVSNVVRGGKWYLSRVAVELVALCEPLTHRVYDKGSEYFGIVEVEEEEIPDGDKGWLEEGGLNESYCVVTMGDEEDGYITYYYEKIEE